MSTDEVATLIDEESESNTNKQDKVFDLPFKLRARPAQYSLDDEIQFSCHKDIACFNKCCRNIEIQLTPYDILRLKKHLTISSKEFVARFTYPFEMDGQGIPGLRLIHKSKSSECIFLTEEGCSVYQNRPTACRYYPLGNIGVRQKKDHKVNIMYFIMKEDRCLGHNEAKTQTVREYLHEQGAAQYDQYNDDWRDIIINKRSSGPAIGKPSERSMQLFDMCSYDIDSFRDFIQTSSFLNLFNIDHQMLDFLTSNDEELLLFAMRFLKQVLFGRKTIPMKQAAMERSFEKREFILQQRLEAEKLAHEPVDALEELIEH